MESPRPGDSSVASSPLQDLEESLETVVPQEDTSESQMVEMADGLSFQLDVVPEVLKERWSIFLTPLGYTDAGKTTLICGVYEQFIRGELKRYASDSDTLVSFEQKVHEARVASRRLYPQIVRTGRRPTEFLHFGLKQTNADAPRCQLLMADVPGERFAEVRNLDSACQEFQFIKRADYVPFLIDGVAIADPLRRASEAASVEAILARLLQQGLIGASTRLDVIISKADKIDNSGPRATQVAGALLRKIKENYAPHVLQVRTILTDLTSLFEKKPAGDLMEMVESWFKFEPFVLADCGSNDRQTSISHQIDAFEINSR